MFPHKLGVFRQINFRTRISLQYVHSKRLVTTTVQNKNLECFSCGIELQDKDPKKIGFYIKPKPQISNKITTIEDVRYLLFSQDVQQAKELTKKSEESIISHEMIDKDGRKRIVCKRCSDALYQNKYNKEEFPAYTLQDIENKFLSRTHNETAYIHYIMPLSDFPHNVDREIFKLSSKYAISKNNKSDRNTDNLSLLLSKGDQLGKNEFFLKRKALPFFKIFFEKYLHFKSNKIVAFSAYKNWNVSSVYSLLKNSKNYLIGTANAGKSTLINSLLKNYKGFKLNSKTYQKVDNKLNKGDENTEDSMYHNTGIFHLQKAGVSHIPNLTRNATPYMIDNEKLIYDLPGYTTQSALPSDIEYDLSNYVSKKYCDLIRKTHRFDNSKVNKRPYTTLKGTENGKCYTLGGLFYYVAPPNTINRVTQFIPGESYQFKNIDKGLEILNELLDTSNPKPYSHPLSGYFYVNSKKLTDKNNFVRHVIPPFQGGIEIVLKDIGYFQVTSTGSYNYEGLHEIWVPKGIKVAVREPLMKLIDLTFDRYHEAIKEQETSNCENTNKNNGKKKRQKIHYDDFFPSDRCIISDTYPMAHEEDGDLLLKMKEIFLERTANDIMQRKYVNVDPHSIVEKLHERPVNLFWYYKI
ncbi:related to Genetic interactor of prohibitins 3, mitochondrial [Saccharomycodes ludwigii]|uniref:Genetic interactor of prohibitins 3, mitochondrial n=1 Tax=Saccharomycodes ludwigii TaxID=36035 RepID=A0A376B405_9ASCO|nr:related to Genetic interactor of prohibitins 3, mitochondrial [Saccharomycodes ludwigii]